MPRRNKNVRQRNVPRAAQRLPKGTQRAQLLVDDSQQYSTQQLGSGWKPQEIPAQSTVLPSWLATGI